jgi:pimeloyl-ACP methyl ester carboxylesterase
MAHQIVGALRDGGYEAGGRGGPAFARVALAGNSAGGLLAPIEAYSFHDVDALLLFASAFDQLPNLVRVLAIAASTGEVACFAGAERKRPGAAGGYAYTFKGAEAFLFYNADPAAVANLIRHHERDPCGFAESIAPTLVADLLHIHTITVPVLLVAGDHDAVFPPPNGQRQRALYTGSRDATLMEFKDSGHAITSGRTAPQVRAAVSRWLAARGF